MDTAAKIEGPEIFVRSGSSTVL